MFTRKTAVLALVLTSTNVAAVRAQHDMAHMGGMGTTMPALPLGIPLSRLGSGTSWLPDSSPMFAAHRMAGSWALMLHGAAFGQYDDQGGLHGAKQTGLSDWEMLMALRSVSGGLLRLSAMTSLQPLVDGARGYPELLQTGGSYNGGRIVDRQHPNELFMELGAAYDHSLMNGLAGTLYAAAVGEPALGPVAYMHRPSAEEDPFAPIGHHWQDASHESFGVLTAGVYSRVAKLEGSVFNGRDADAYHLNLDYNGARFDSYAGRLTVLPGGNVSVSAWGGYLYGHDRLESAVGMQRYGASVLTSSSAFDGRTWSNAVVWGMNIHHHGSREHIHDPNVPVKPYHLASSVLLESTLDVTPRVAVFGRLEQVQKTADDLGFLGGDAMQAFNVRSASLGATREILARGDASVGVGARGTLTLLPQSLRLIYQTRRPTGFAVYLRVRPARMRAR